MSPKLAHIRNTSAQAAFFFFLFIPLLLCVTFLLEAFLYIKWAESKNQKIFLYNITESWEATVWCQVTTNISWSHIKRWQTKPWKLISLSSDICDFLSRWRNMRQRRQWQQTRRQEAQGMLQLCPTNTEETHHAWFLLCLSQPYVPAKS